MSRFAESFKLARVRAALLLALAGGALAGCGYPDGPYTDYEATTRVRSVLNICPHFVGYTVSPLQTSIEGKIQLEVEVEDVDDDELFYAWYAETGAFSDPETLATSYTCKEQGSQALLITTSDGKCDRALSFDITCVAPPAR